MSGWLLAGIIKQCLITKSGHSFHPSQWLRGANDADYLIALSSRLSKETVRALDWLASIIPEWLHVLALRQTPFVLIMDDYGESVFAGYLLHPMIDITVDQR